MLQTNPRFMAKLLEQLGGCAAIKAEFLGASQDARYKEGIRALISLWQAIQVVFRGLVVDIKPPEPNFYSSFYALGAHFYLPLQVNINLHDLKSQHVYLVSNKCKIFGLNHSR